MKKLIVFYSKTGHTRRVATDLAKNLQDKLRADYISFEDILEKYKLFIVV